MYFFCLSILFTITNSVDPDEMPRYAAFHLIFTVCKSTRLGFYRIERVKKLRKFSSTFMGLDITYLG